MLKLIKKVSDLPREEVNSFLDRSMKEHKKVNVVTANPEIIMHGTRTQEIYDFLLGDDTLITPDGIGVVKAYNRLFNADIARLAGVDTVKDMLSLINTEKRSLFVYGARQEVLDKFRIKLENEYPNIIIKGLFNGYDHTLEQAHDYAMEAQADLVLIALGVPRQELFMIQCSDINKGVFIGCGGSIDVLSGMTKRAPKLVMKLNLEWLYRIAFKPKRMKRFWDNQVIFFLRVYKLGVKKND